MFYINNAIYCHLQYTANNILQYIALRPNRIGRKQLRPLFVNKREMWVFNHIFVLHKCAVQCQVSELERVYAHSI